MKILDLFAGIGGTAKGIHKALEDNNIKDYEYIAIEINSIIAKTHKENNPKSTVIVGDAFDFLNGKIEEYNFIWASPPCHTHSRVNWLMKRYDPDPSLWQIIQFLKENAKAFVVENVIPYYKPPIPITFTIDRHAFWSSFPIAHFKTKERAKNLRWMKYGDFQKYHELDPPKEGYDKRKSLRNVVNPVISYNIFSQFLNPKQKKLEDFTKA